MCKTNFTEKKIVLSLHYNSDNSYLFINGVEQLKFKTDTNEILKKSVMLTKHIIRFQCNQCNKNWVVWNCL